MAPEPNFIQVRKALPEDLTAAITVIETTWGASNDEDLSAGSISSLAADRAISTLVTNRQKDLWVADCDGVLVGTLGVDGTGHIWAIYVLPGFHRRGIGSALLDAAEVHFRTVGLTSLTLDILEKNTAAQAFYSARGWQMESSREEHLPGERTIAIRYIYQL